MELKLEKYHLLSGGQKHYPDFYSFEAVVTLHNPIMNPLNDL